MKKYEVKLEETEITIIEIYAEDKEDAYDKAIEMWKNADFSSALSVVNASLDNDINIEVINEL